MIPELGGPWKICNGPGAEVAPSATAVTKSANPSAFLPFLPCLFRRAAPK